MHRIFSGVKRIANKGFLWYDGEKENAYRLTQHTDKLLFIVQISAQPL